MKVARIIPVTGIGSEVEAEQRATSATLAVLSIVNDLATALLGPMGAPGAKRSRVEAFTEVYFGGASKRDRPDGLIVVTYGKTQWRALVEVKTGSGTLDADQINRYWDIARTERMNAVITISNEIPAEHGSHPTPGLKVTAKSPVRVHHLSWSEVLLTARRIKDHTPIDDPEQSWLLNELIRYLEHPNSGALTFDDMGPHWVAVREAAATKTLNSRSLGTEEVVTAWERLIGFAALRLSSAVGEDVRLVLAGDERKNRSRALKSALCERGVLDATLRIPKTAGDLELEADLRAGQLTAAISVRAPQDRGARARVTWLLNQVGGASPDLLVESYPKNVKTPAVAPLGEIIEDKRALLDDLRRDPCRFRVVARTPMGSGRKSGRKSSFIESVLGLIDTFYDTVVQEIREWQPPTPQRLVSESEPQNEDE
ncbi:MAG: hypothetical protein QY307_07265 [Acidimicrobiia bacterium]|nr:MAG: hypothetical protein QY307_07265 [Acidimicrobiia bacterium]